MANWGETIDLSDIHALYKEGRLDIKTLGKITAQRLKTTHWFFASDLEMIDIICAFGGLDEYSSLEDYNTVLDFLYEFGDHNNKLWITAEPEAKTNSRDIRGDKIIDMEKDKTGECYRAPPPHTDLCHHEDRFKDNSKWKNGGYNDFDNRLSQYNIDQKDIPNDVYNYIKNANVVYQKWLLENVEGFRELKVKKEQSMGQG